MQAYIFRPELAKFRRRAWKAYAKRKEYIEAMFGIIHNGVVVVSMFYPIKHEADFGSCSFHNEDDHTREDEVFDDLAEIAKESGLRLIGTIHSHPGYNTCRHLSNRDVRHCITNWQHELLTGTMHIFKKGGRSRSQSQFTCLFEPVDVKFITRKKRIRS